MNDSMFQGATGANSVAADSRIWQRIRRRMHTSTASGENR
jgi:hypothetical protein